MTPVGFFVPFLDNFGIGKLHEQQQKRSRLWIQTPKSGPGKRYSHFSLS